MRFSEDTGVLTRALSILGNLLGTSLDISRYVFGIELIFAYKVPKSSLNSLHIK